MSDTRLKTSGFTLLELAVMLAILSALAALSFPYLRRVVAVNRERRAVAFARAAADALCRYWINNDRLPDNLTVLATEGYFRASPPPGTEVSFWGGTGAGDPACLNTNTYIAVSVRNPDFQGLVLDRDISYDAANHTYTAYCVTPAPYSDYFFKAWLGPDGNWDNASCPGAELPWRP
ncbi:hypothetical protein [Thermosulfurimonas sp. F29]|uniref:hypothetical protein n=1 Tax=Thermosulfurimonas sp. F29 TaxID=2867247 RepID=UPI001C838362|nr:hypothetical protein [Thermosulfurimonas sp. F29]MBX6423403.1 hypothetical protein [Thermosulfurimonas sp. F29]